MDKDSDILYSVEGLKNTENESVDLKEMKIWANSGVYSKIMKWEWSYIDFDTLNNQSNFTKGENENIHSVGPTCLEIDKGYIIEGTVYECDGSGNPNKTKPIADAAIVVSGATSALPTEWIVLGVTYANEDGYYGAVLTTDQASAYASFKLSIYAPLDLVTNS